MNCSAYNNNAAPITWGALEISFILFFFFFSDVMSSSVCFAVMQVMTLCQQFCPQKFLSEQMILKYFEIQTLKTSFWKTLKSSSDLKHGTDNGYHGD